MLKYLTTILKMIFNKLNGLIIIFVSLLYITFFGQLIMINIKL